MSIKRISILDSFRCLAILAVMLYHFSFRWTTPMNTSNLYPYGQFFGRLFVYGCYGVQFFFIISGFVISYTLENTTGIGAFWKNRMIRLLPSIIVCSILTFALISAFDHANLFPEAHAIRNFLPSWTFTKPELWTMVFHKPFSYISLSYWSLWVEVQFYIIASLFYFLWPGHFVRKIILLALVIDALNWIPVGFMLNPASYHFPSILQLPLTKIYFFTGMFNLKYHLSWFTMGVVFHQLYLRRSLRFLSVEGMGIFLIVVNHFITSENWQVRLLNFIMLLLFVLLVYRESALRFLDLAILRRIGFLSYTIYLIHETLGVFLINRFGGYLGSWSPLSPFIVILLSIGFGELSYRLYEKRASSFLKKYLFGSDAKPKLQEKKLVA